MEGGGGGDGVCVCGRVETMEAPGVGWMKGRKEKRLTQCNPSVRMLPCNLDDHTLLLVPFHLVFFAHCPTKAARVLEGSIRAKSMKRRGSGVRRGKRNCDMM